MMGGGLVPVLPGGAQDQGQAQGPLPSTPPPLVPTPLEAIPKKPTRERWAGGGLVLVLNGGTHQDEDKHKAPSRPLSRPLSLHLNGGAQKACPISVKLRAERKSLDK